MGTADQSDWLDSEVSSLSEWVLHYTGARWPFWVALVSTLVTSCSL